MKVKVKVDAWILIFLWLINIFFIVVAFLMPSEEIWVFLVFILPVLIVIVWILLGSYYEFQEDLLYMRLGPFFGRIKYDNIKSLALKQNLLSSMALSSKRIEIKEHNKGYIRGTTYISPINREEFLKQLKIRCYYLEKNE